MHPTLPKGGCGAAGALHRRSLSGSGERWTQGQLSCGTLAAASKYYKGLATGCMAAAARTRPRFAAAEAVWRPSLGRLLGAEAASQDGPYGDETAAEVGAEAAYDATRRPPRQGW